MGATNSTPSNIALKSAANSLAPELQVTSQVIKRLEEAKRKALQGPPMPPMPPAPSAATQFATPSALQLKTTEVEQKQFMQTLSKLQELFGNPVLWAEHCAAGLDEARKELIQCHSDYPHEPLRCHHLAQQYQQLIFSQQYGAILKVKQVVD